MRIEREAEESAPTAGRRTAAWAATAIPDPEEVRSGVGRQTAEVSELPERHGSDLRSAPDLQNGPNVWPTASDDRREVVDPRPRTEGGTSIESQSQPSITSELAVDSPTDREPPLGTTRS